MAMNSGHRDIPESKKSYWREFEGMADYPQLQGNESTEVGVVGGGIAGIISAYLLAKAGKKVTLIDAGELVDGATGYTTAKISAQHDLIYNQLIKMSGEVEAKKYFDANMDGLEFIKNTAEELGIDCDFEHHDAFVYANTEAGAKLVEQEAEAYEKLGIPGGLAKEETDLPFDVKQAIVMRNQAQFHPVKFLAGLVKEFERLGGTVYEKTRAIKILSKKNPVIQTENMSHLSCDQVIVATHFPFSNADGMYFARMSVERSYVVAAKVRGDIPKHMYISTDKPSRSLRYTTDDNGEKLLLIGGEDHGAGKHKGDTMENYEKLAEWGDEHFGVKAIPYRWSAQDMTTLDKIPYIGTSTVGHENILVATGFNKWGMAHGAVAGMLLRDQILGNENRYASIYDPTRTKLKPADLASFAKDNASVAKELVTGKLKRPAKTPESLGKGEGASVKTAKGAAGGYRDQYGQLHLVDTTCTHLGCETKWNNAERSWDCPCHGSRFSYTGEVLEGPAVKPLKRMEE